MELDANSSQSPPSFFAAGMSQYSIYRLFRAPSASFFNLELADTNQQDHETLPLSESLEGVLNESELPFKAA